MTVKYVQLPLLITIFTREREGGGGQSGVGIDIE